MGIFRLSDGTLETTLKLPDSSMQLFRQRQPGQPPQWTADSRSIVYIDTQADVGNLWALPVDGSAPHQLTRFDKDRIFTYAFSPDGQRLALSRGNTSGDLVVIRNFR
jgi:Tol biopolymer transport system component